MSEYKGTRYVEVDNEQAGTPEYVVWLEAKLSKMEGLEIRISDGDVWLHFPNAAISIEGICNSRAPGPIVKRNLRAWRDKALAGGDGEQATKPS